MTAPARPALARRRLTQAEARAANHLAVRAAPLLLTAAGVRLAAAVIGPIPVVDGAPWLLLTVDGHPAAAQVAWGNLRHAAGVPVEGLPGPEAALLVEEPLAPWLDEIEAALGASLRFTDVTLQPPEGLVPRGWGLQGQSAGKAALRQAGALMLSVEAALVLGRAMRKMAVARDELPELSLRLQAEIDGVVLRLADLRSLQPGDALKLDLSDGHARLVLEGQRVAPARQDGVAWHLTGPFRPRLPFPPAPPFEGLRMNEDTAPPKLNDETKAPLSGLEDMDIRLSFRLGDTLVSLAELRQLAPGAVITLDRPDGSLVEIIANGRKIGTGEVIAVGGQRAVEIRSLFTDG